MDALAPKKPHAGLFKKGQSGNIRGRPPRTQEEIDIAKACREKSRDAFNVIVEIMERGEDEKNRLKAAQTILERGFGKPEQHNTHAGQLTFQWAE